MFPSISVIRISWQLLITLFSENRVIRVFAFVDLRNSGPCTCIRTGSGTADVAGSVAALVKPSKVYT